MFQSTFLVFFSITTAKAQKKSGVSLRLCAKSAETRNNIRLKNCLSLRARYNRLATPSPSAVRRA